MVGVLSGTGIQGIVTADDETPILLGVTWTNRIRPRSQWRRG